MQDQMACGAGRNTSVSGIWSLVKIALFSVGRVSVPRIVCGHPSGAVYGTPPSRGFVRQVIPSILVNSTPQCALTENAARPPTGNEYCGETCLPSVPASCAEPQPTSTSPVRLSVRVRRVNML